MDWFEFPGALNDLETHPAYQEKMAADAQASPPARAVPARRRRTRPACSWIRKRQYKKKMVRRFLTINPHMDYSRVAGMRCRRAIYLCVPGYEDGEFYDPKEDYSFNPYTKVFLSPRGDLRKFHGSVFPGRCGYALASKDKDAVKMTNRRIRRRAAEEEQNGSYAFCRKLYAPAADEVW